MQDNLISKVNSKDSHRLFSIRAYIGNYKRMVVYKLATILLIALFIPHPAFGSGTNTAGSEKQSVNRDPNVILISLDNLRMDRLGCYGYKKGTTPNIDALAKKGVIFEPAITQAPWTTPSHMSMLTGLYPSGHGVDQTALFKSIKPNPKIKILTEILSKHGYYNIAIVTGDTVSEEWGFDRGFDSFVKIPAHVNGKSNMAESVNRAKDWLSQNADKKFFLFYHSFEIHCPWTGKRFIKQSLEMKLIDSVLSLLYGSGLIHNKPQYYNWTRRQSLLYDGDVFVADKFIGEIIEKLHQLNLFDNTLLIITSDHGEEFKQHDKIIGHGHSVYDEVLKVPLIMTFPPQLPSKRIKKQVRLIDIMPTVLELLNISPDTNYDGISLVGLIEEEDGFEELPAFSEANCRGPMRKSIRTSNYKYIYMPESTEALASPYKRVLIKGEKEELYNLKFDSQERYNLLSDKTNWLIKFIQRTFYQDIKEVRDNFYNMMMEFMGRHNSGYHLVFFTNKKDSNFSGKIITTSRFEGVEAVQFMSGEKLELKNSGKEIEFKQISGNKFLRKKIIFEVDDPTAEISFDLNINNTKISKEDFFFGSQDSNPSQIPAIVRVEDLNTLLKSDGEPPAFSKGTGYFLYRVSSPKPQEGKLSEETKKRLKALGYIQ